MAEKHNYEMTDNECYSSLTAQREKAATSTQSAGRQQGTAAETAPSSSKKYYRWIVALAILFNFLLIIAVGAALSHYQTKTATDEASKGFTGGSSGSGPSG